MDWDDAYANAPYIPEAETYPDRWAAGARAFRDRLSDEGRAQLGIAYGDSERQRYDLFLPKGAHVGTCVFVHGGYWLKFHRSFWSHLAAGPLARGWAVAMPSYDLCPDVSIAGITRQIAAAISMIAETRGGPLMLAGHSAGGHLVARMLAPGMLAPEVLARITRVAPISMLSDLRPLIQTAMNADLRLDAEEAAEESPLLQPRPDTKVALWVGAEERPAFLDQTRWHSEAWDVPQHILPGRHHFDVIEPLEDAQSGLVRFLTGHAA